MDLRAYIHDTREPEFRVGSAFFARGDCEDDTEGDNEEAKGSVETSPASGTPYPYHVECDRVRDFAVSTECEYPGSADNRGFPAWR